MPSCLTACSAGARELAVAVGGVDVDDLEALTRVTVPVLACVEDRVGVEAFRFDHRVGDAAGRSTVLVMVVDCHTADPVSVCQRRRQGTGYRASYPDGPSLYTSVTVAYVKPKPSSR
jgi:hypothetical protein